MLWKVECVSIFHGRLAFCNDKFIAPLKLYRLALPEQEDYSKQIFPMSWDWTSPCILCITIEQQWLKEKHNDNGRVLWEKRLSFFPIDPLKSVLLIETLTNNYHSCPFKLRRVAINNVRSGSRLLEGKPFWSCDWEWCSSARTCRVRLAFYMKSSTFRTRRKASGEKTFVQERLWCSYWWTTSWWCTLQCESGVKNGDSLHSVFVLIFRFIFPVMLKHSKTLWNVVHWWWGTTGIGNIHLCCQAGTKHAIMTYINPW